MLVSERSSVSENILRKSHCSVGCVAKVDLVDFPKLEINGFVEDEKEAAESLCVDG